MAEAPMVERPMTASAPAGSADQCQPRRARPTILLVDNDPLQLKFGRLQLLEAGFLVETAAGADEALVRARQGRPDAILCDVLMGDVDGYGFCRHLKEEPALASIPLPSRAG